MTEPVLEYLGWGRQETDFLALGPEEFCYSGVT